MLLAGLQDVGHEDVATGRGGFSLRSLKQGPSASYSIELQRLEAQDISIATAGEEHPLRASVLCSSLLSKPLQHLSIHLL